MNSETWLQKAERLQRMLASREEDCRDRNDESEHRERITIALWLRREFCVDITESAELPETELFS